MALRGKCIFNAQLQEKYPFLEKAKEKANFEVYCKICKAEINIANGGRYTIEKHTATIKHIKSAQAAACSRNVTEFFSTPAINKKIAACEGVWAYHAAKENHSFLSSDCASKLFRTCFELHLFHCARTKCESIVKNVFAPYIRGVVKTDLSKRRYVSITTDASNHGNVKMMPVLARYFIPTVGVQVKLLTLSSEKGETSAIVEALLKRIADDYEIRGKIVGFCGDNCPTNFGSSGRGGTNNVFYRLKKWQPGMIGIGCGAHVIHNALKSACDQLPLDVECIVVKIYSSFYIYTVRVEELKAICDLTDVYYKQLLGYAKTRYLALGPAIESILQLFDPLKKYFTKKKNCPRVIKDFFEEPLSRLWLLFVKEQAECCRQTVLKIEGDNVSAVEVHQELEVLRGEMLLRREEKYLHTETELELHKLTESGEFDIEILLEVFTDFYDNILEYLDEWSAHLQVFNEFSWIFLESFPNWTTVKKAAIVVAEKTEFDMVTHSAPLFRQFGLAKKFCSEEKLAEWRANKVSVSKRWVELFKHMEAKCIPFCELAAVIEFILCFPGTSAPAERVFAHAKKVWKVESARLQMPTLDAILQIKCNMEWNCIDFFYFLANEPNLLRQISKQCKYDFKADKPLPRATATATATTTSTTTSANAAPTGVPIATTTATSRCTTTTTTAEESPMSVYGISSDEDE